MFYNNSISDKLFYCKITKMNNIVLSSPKSIFVLYLIISGNFLANLFGCRTQELMNTSMAMKHLLGFMTMYFFVVLVDSQSKLGDTPSIQLLVTLGFYLIFMLTTRMDYKWWVAFILMLSVIYILQVYKEHPKSTEEESKRYETAQQVLTYITGAVVVIGFLIYLGRKRSEYGDKFTFSTFLLGKTSCSNNREPVVLTDFEALKSVFKR